MDSDDDYKSFSPFREPSPQIHHRRLKRLRKKAIPASSNPLPDSVDDVLSIPRVDFAALEALEASETKTLDSQCDDSNESSSLLPDSIDDLLPIPRVDFAKLEAEEASGTRTPDSQFDDSNEPSNSQPESINDLLPIPRVDFAKLEALEASLTKTLDDSNGPLLNQSSSGHENEMESGFGEHPEVAKNTSQFGHSLAFGEDRRETKRALEFDDVDLRKGELRMETSEKKQVIEGSRRGGDDEEENAKKKKNKRIKSDNGDEWESKARAPNKRTQEKERKAYLQQLHAESQRLLRETRDASFKPVSIVNKPISSILEKIRKRKLEVSKSNSSIYENNYDLRDDVLATKSENASVELKEGDSVKAVEEDSAVNQVDAQIANPMDMDNSNVYASPSSYGKFPTQKDCDEKSPPMFRPPIDDTQDLFGDSQTREREGELPVDDLDSPGEEVFVPSLLAMNLKFDSVPSNDSSEDNDKENVDPFSHGCEDDYTSPKGDPVKAFVDEEAEEEDDSDNDQLLFKETEEDEDMEDSEELNDIIATEYEEKPIDNERRNELHQKWLEQQDAAGTDNLLQRLKVGSKLRETTPLDQEKDDYEDEEYNDAGEEDTELRFPTRMNLKKAKQVISQMFLDKDDTFLSDEDEETEKKIAKNRLVRAEEQASLVSPVEDESSREVFGLIKKLNIAPESRKKAKASSYLDSVLKGGDGKSFSKSSFLGRMSNYHLPSSHKKGSTTVRSFIFGRDDSNSRSSIPNSDEPTDTISKENQPIRTVTAKFTSSQTKFSNSRYRNASAETAPSTSLFEILRRSSEQTSVCNRDDPVDLTRVMDTFKIPKKPIKIGN